MISNAEKLRLAANGWGEDGNGPVVVITPSPDDVRAPGKPGTDPLTFSEDAEDEFRAVKDAYLARVPKPVFREDGPVSHVGDDEDFPEDGDLIVGDMAYDDDDYADE